MKGSVEHPPLLPENTRPRRACFFDGTAAAELNGRGLRKGEDGAGRHFAHIAIVNSPGLTILIRHKHGTFYDGTAALNTKGFALARLLGLRTLSGEESSTYVTLNHSTPCPPRSAVSVNSKTWFRGPVASQHVQFAFDQSGDRTSYAALSVRRFRCNASRHSKTSPD